VIRYSFLQDGGHAADYIRAVVSLTQYRLIVLRSKDTVGIYRLKLRRSVCSVFIPSLQFVCLSFRSCSTFPFPPALSSLVTLTFDPLTPKWSAIFTYTVLESLSRLFWNFYAVTIIESS